jgi:hypothetical protein
MLPAAAAATLPATIALPPTRCRRIAATANVLPMLPLRCPLPLRCWRAAATAATALPPPLTLRCHQAAAAATVAYVLIVVVITVSIMLCNWEYFGI